MATARFRIHPQLHPFLAPARRQEAFDYRCARAATMKNALEALGIPHTEVASLQVNGALATLDRSVREGDEIAAQGWFAIQALQPVVHRIFIADAHLGALARFLRMLGFDTLHDNALSDEAIRNEAAASHRIVLTRDRELLKCREIVIGAYVRALRPEAQLREVWARFDLAPYVRPFSLCLCCNVPLENIAKQAVIERLPEQVVRSQQRFWQCLRCRRIYWPGSHYERMRAALEQTLQSALVLHTDPAGTCQESPD